MLRYNNDNEIAYHKHENKLYINLVITTTVNSLLKHVKVTPPNMAINILHRGPNTLDYMCVFSDFMFRDNLYKKLGVP